MTVEKASCIILLFLLRSALCIPFSEFYKRQGSYSGGELTAGRHVTDTDGITFRIPYKFYGREEFDIKVSCLIVWLAIMRS